MRFDLNDLNPGAWFDLVEGKPEEGRICVRVLNNEERVKIIKACTKHKVEYKKGQRFPVSDFDDDKHTRMLWDYCITGWEHLEDASGEPIECTAENKMALVQGSNEFRDIVTRCLDRLNEDEKVEAEASEKN